MVKSLTIRARLASSTFSWPEDLPNLRFLLPVLKLAMLADVPGLNRADDVVRLNGVDRNNAEHEPLLLIAAGAWGYLTAGNPGPLGLTVLYTVLVSRCLHNAFMTFRLEPWRTFAYLPTLGAFGFISVQALFAFKK